MIKQNNILVGILAGAILPALVWIIFNYWQKGLVLMNRPLLPYFTVIAINLLLVRWSHRSNADKISRGIIVSTFLFLVVIFLIKVRV